MTNVKRRVNYQYGTLVPEPRRRGPDIWVYRFFENRARGFDARRSSEHSTKCRSVRRLSEPVRNSDSLRMRRMMRALPRWAGSSTGTSKKCSKPCLKVPLGGVQEESAAMSFQTAGSYRSMLSKYVLARWESYRVSEFDRSQVRASIEQWLASLQRSTGNSAGLAPKTVRHIFSTMKLVFKFAVKWGYLGQNPNRTEAAWRKPRQSPPGG